MFKRIPSTDYVAIANDGTVMEVKDGKTFISDKYGNVLEVYQHSSAKLEPIGSGYYFKLEDVEDTFNQSTDEWIEEEGTTFKSMLDNLETGALKSNQSGRGRYDLISPYMLEGLALHLEKSLEKYEEGNYKKGIPIKRYISSIMRHLNQFRSGDRTEDHLSAIVANVMMLEDTLDMIEQSTLSKDLLN